MSEDEDDNTQEMGLEFGDLYDDLETEEYPLAMSDVIDRYGDREIEHSSGSETVENILSGYQEDQEFQGAEEVRQTILNMVGTEAVGRDRYSDRGENPDSNQESF